MTEYIFLTRCSWHCKYEIRDVLPPGGGVCDGAFEMLIYPLRFPQLNKYRGAWNTIWMRDITCCTNTRVKMQHLQTENFWKIKISMKLISNMLYKKTVAETLSRLNRWQYHTSNHHTKCYDAGCVHAVLRTLNMCVTAIANGLKLHL